MLKRVGFLGIAFIALWFRLPLLRGAYSMGLLPLSAANVALAVGSYLVWVVPILIVLLVLRIGGRVRSVVSGLLLPRPISRLLDRITPERADRWLAKRSKGSTSPLLNGSREAFARSAWPAARYPTLYRSIPADVRRSVVWDGRLLGGSPVTWLAWRHVSADMVPQVVRAGGRIGVRAAVIVALLGAVAVLLSLPGSQLFAFQSWPYPSWSEGLSIWPRVGWGITMALEFTVSLVMLIVSTLKNLGLVLLGALLLAPAFMFFATWRGFHAWWSRASQALATPTRDSLVVFKNKADIRDAEYLAYTRQVERAVQLQQEGQPTIALGRAMGVFRARGDMEAPDKGQEVCLDGDSIRQHMLILGGTGAGKTRLVVKPLFRRILSADWGQGHRIGAYVTDGKGTLWQDLQNSPVIAYRTDKVVVGTGPGQVAIDPLKGMTPLEVATTLRAVGGQVAGKPSDDFWPESASLLIMHAATIAEVLDLDEDTLAGQAWSNYRPWSLLGIGLLATSKTAVTAAIVRVREICVMGSEDADQVQQLRAAARAAGQDEDQAEAGYVRRLTPRMLRLVGDDALATSVEWFEGAWASMAGETQGSITANVNIILGKLGGAGELRDRFCTGLYPDVVDINHALDGGILMIAVGETEWGMVGKVISVWLKTRLYIAARKRLQSDPAACRNTSCAVFADEWQMLATTGPDSDASFWNIARETGVFLCAATQSLAALKQVLGDDATANIVNLLRTKVILKTEEVSTLDYCIKLAGQTMRGIITENAFYETQGQREIEMPDVAPAPDLGEAISIRRIMPVYPRMTTSSTRPVKLVDSRFYKRMGRGSLFGGNGAGSADGALGAEQQAFWRQEDKEKEVLGGGISHQPKITTDELLLGAGLAFVVVQRAGCDRSDIVDLEDMLAA